MRRIVPAVLLACLASFAPVTASSPALAQESPVNLQVPLRGMLLPLLNQERVPVGAVRLDLSIEARKAEDVPVITALTPRIRDALLTRVPPPAASEGLNLSSSQLEAFRRSILQAVRHALGPAAAVSDIHFVNVLAMPG